MLLLTVSFGGLIGDIRNVRPASNGPLNIVCLATYFKGVDFIRECKGRGHQVVLITKEKMLGEDWPRESLDDLIALPNDADLDMFLTC